MALCNECNFYRGSGGEGKCKYEAPIRTVQGVSSGTEDRIINGWPVVDGTLEKCGRFESVGPP